MPDAHKNAAYSLIAVAPTPASSGTAITVTTGEGALFPATPFNAVIWPTGVQPTAANMEVVRVTLRVTDVLTITRTQESSSARTVIVGDQISAAVTNLTLTDIESSMKVVSSSGAYAITAADCGKIISQTGNSAANIAVTVAATAATLGNGFHFYIEHAGTGTSGANKKLVFTPTTSTVDGAATITDYPGILRLITSDGTNWVSKLLRGGFIDVAVADSVYTFDVPTGWTTMEVGAWGAGGSGGGGTGAAVNNGRAGGSAGGGAKCNSRWFIPGDLGASVTCTVGAGSGSVAGGTGSAGSNGGVGNNTTFGTLITAYAGGGGSAGLGGGAGAGGTAVGASSTTGTGGTGGAAFGAGTAPNTSSATDAGGGGGTSSAGSSSFRGGAGGGSGGSTAGGTGGGGSAFSAAGGGGGGGITAANPGVSGNGGAGGNTGCGTVTTTGGGGTAGVANGGTAAGTATQTDKRLGGQGGGGGGGNNAGTGGAGATGTVPGGGGGGGGGGTNVGGASGNGGAGAIRIWYWP